MIIGGLQKFSMIDYPGKTCAIIFTVGCNFRCAYCHNPELVTGKVENDLKERDILQFLESRKGKLDAVTITGGEPTLHKDLIPFIKKIKEMGFLVKLDSNGTHPDVLRKVIDENIVDYVAMDIKAPEKKYTDIVGMPVNMDDLKESISLIINEAPDYEFRTTVVASQLEQDDFEKMGKLIKSARRYYLQKFVPTKTLNSSFMKEKTYSDIDFERIRKNMLNYVDFCDVR